MVITNKLDHEMPARRNRIETDQKLYSALCSGQQTCTLVTLTTLEEMGGEHPHALGHVGASFGGSCILPPSGTFSGRKYLIVCPRASFVDAVRGRNALVCRDLKFQRHKFVKSLVILHNDERPIYRIVYVRCSSGFVWGWSYRVNVFHSLVIKFGIRSEFFDLFVVMRLFLYVNLGSVLPLELIECILSYLVTVKRSHCESPDGAYYYDNKPTEHVPRYFRLFSSLSGNNGEWTNGDDMARKTKAKGIEHQEKVRARKEASNKLLHSVNPGIGNRKGVKFGPGNVSAGDPTLVSKLKDSACPEDSGTLNPLHYKHALSDAAMAIDNSNKNSIKSVVLTIGSVAGDDSSGVCSPLHSDCGASIEAPVAKPNGSVKIKKISEGIMQLHCRDCECEFEYTLNEQNLFNQKGYDAPVRCKPCIKLNKVSKAAKKAEFDRLKADALDLVNETKSVCSELMVDNDHVGETMEGLTNFNRDLSVFNKFSDVTKEVLTRVQGEASKSCKQKKDPEIVPVFIPSSGPELESQSVFLSCFPWFKRYRRGLLKVVQDDVLINLPRVSPHRAILSCVTIVPVPVGYIWKCWRSRKDRSPIDMDVVKFEDLVESGEPDDWANRSGFISKFQGSTVLELENELVLQFGSTVNVDHYTEARMTMVLREKVASEFKSPLPDVLVCNIVARASFRIKLSLARRISHAGATANRVLVRQW